MLVFYSRWIQKLWGGISRLRKHSSLWGKKGGVLVFVYLNVSRVGGYSLNSYGVMIVVVRGATKVDGQSKHTDENLVEARTLISQMSQSHHRYHTELFSRPCRAPL